MSSHAVRRILFPTDFSDNAGRAGQVAGDLARHFGAELHVLHVVPHVTDPEPAFESLREAVAAIGRGVRVTAATATGGAARGIVGYARDQDIDLIVMSTHGRTGFSHALLGSVTEAVVRRAPCQVLNVPAVDREALAPEPESAAEQSRCRVCHQRAAELICAGCRALIRGEALQRKPDAEHAGRTGAT